MGLDAGIIIIISVCVICAAVLISCGLFDHPTSDQKGKKR